MIDGPLANVRNRVREVALDPFVIASLHPKDFRSFAGNFILQSQRVQRDDQVRIIVPVHVAGPTSRLFHLFDRISPELRDITLFHELLNKQGKPFQLTVGPLIAPARLDVDATKATFALKAYVERVLPTQPDAEFA